MGSCKEAIRPLLIIVAILVLLVPMPVAATENAAKAVSVPHFLQDANSPESAAPLHLPDPVRGKGELSVTIESYSGINPKRASQLADRAELWVGDRRIAALDLDSTDIDSEKNRRIFKFPEITLESGYYFITLRLYSQGALHGRHKSFEKTFQVGIHPDRVSRIYKKIPFFHW
jgi:hypothetical protein